MAMFWFYYLIKILNLHYEKLFQKHFVVQKAFGIFNFEN